MPFIVIALILAAAIGGGTSIVAQNSLPGDALWGFKVGVNENIRAALAADGKAQANFDIEAIEARMKEAGELSAGGRFDAKANDDVEANIDAHVKSIEAQIVRLQDRGDYSGAADVAARYQATVAAHVSALANAQAHASTNANANAQAALGRIINKAQATLDSASDISAEAALKASIQAQAQANDDASQIGMIEEEAKQASSSNPAVHIDTNIEVKGE